MSRVHHHYKINTRREIATYVNFEIGSLMYHDISQ